jgi:hypothetical protein
MTFRLTSSAFAGSGRIPARHTCEGEDLSPPVAWSGVPAAARGLLLLCDDPDAPNGKWHHWALFDIPTATNSLAEGLSKSVGTSGMKHGTNDFRTTGYRGPCPPKGHGIHHYHFRLQALDVAKLNVREGATCAEVESAARSHVLAQAELVGLYERR